MADARKPCRCTLLESGQADMAKLVRDYVDSLSADEKTDEATYAARLNICRTCDNLHSGTCALCGCYVEARAAKNGRGVRMCRKSGARRKRNSIESRRREDAKCPSGGDSMWVMCIMRHTAHRFLLTGTSSIDSC